MQLSLFYISNYRHRSMESLHTATFGHKSIGQHPYRPALWASGLLLPFCSIIVAVSATGPTTHFMVPVFFGAVVMFAGTAVIAECHLLLMENFDTSDLPEPYLASSTGSLTAGPNASGLPHGTQRPASLNLGQGSFTTAHPCLSATFSILYTFCFLFAAISVAASRSIVDTIGIRSGLGLYAGLTIIASIGLVVALWRNTTVRIPELFDGEEKIQTVQISLLQRA
jgi:hypothetical protein